jgi:hypothetical protein
MAKVRPAAGGGRWVDVDPERLPAWLNGFAVRHDGYRVTGVDEPAPHAQVRRGADAPGHAQVRRGANAAALHVVAGDGSTLELYAPPGAALTTDVEAFVVEALRERRIGLLLARQASVAVGIVDGASLTTSKVDTYYVQSRTAAGGWSQQRYARRRENQAKAAAEDAARVAVQWLLPQAESLATLVTGGDRKTVDAILADPRLAPLHERRAERFLAVAEPRTAVLEQAIGPARAVRILVRDPPAPV